MALTNPKKVINVERLNYFKSKLASVFAGLSDFNAVQTIVNALNTDPVTKTQVDTADTANSTAISAEETARTSADTAINAKIPTAASSTNQLADKAYVTDIVSTLSGKLHDAVATKSLLPTTGVNDNDTCCVLADETHSNATWMYQYSSSAWSAKYEVSPTALTTEQYAALNSGITAALVTKINALPSTVSSEVLTFTLSDGSTVSKTFVIGG